jgi:hypothetical protein
MHKEHIAYMSTRSTLQTSVHVHLPLFSKTNKQTNKAGVLRDVDDDDNVAISSSLHISHFTGMAKKDPDQIATNPQEELGKEEQRPKLKTAEERTATTSRAMQAFREEEGVDEKGERGQILLPLTNIQFGEDCQTQSPHIEETEVDCRKSKEAHQQQPDAQPLHPLTLLCVSLCIPRGCSLLLCSSLFCLDSL